MSDFRFQFSNRYQPTQYIDPRLSKQRQSPSEPQETLIPNSESHLNHSPGVLGMLFNETITIKSDSKLEIEANAAENGEGSLQYNGVRPSVNTTSFSTAIAQMDNVNEREKHGAALDLSTTGEYSEKSTINAIFSASCPDSSMKPSELSSLPPAFGLPQADEQDEESQNPITKFKESINYMPTSSTSTPLDNVLYMPESHSLTYLSPIVNILDSETSNNGISSTEPKSPKSSTIRHTRRVEDLQSESFVEPKSPTTRRTRRAEVLQAESTPNRDDSGASNKTSDNYDQSNTNEDDDSDSEDDDDDGSVSEYSPSAKNNGGRRKRHLDNINTDDENEQPSRKRRNHGQSLARRDDQASHSSARTRPSTPISENNSSDPATVAEYEELTFSDYTTVKRTIIGGNELLQIERPVRKEENVTAFDKDCKITTIICRSETLVIERPIERPIAKPIRMERNVTECEKHGKTATELTGNRAKQTPMKPYTTNEDKLLDKLRGKDGLSWDDVYKQFNNEFPNRRSRASLQVRYSTKLRSKS